MKETSGVYKITNKITGKFYIGSSKHIESRFKEHKKMLNDGWHNSEDLQNDWDTYGEDNFDFSILIEADEAEARKLEIEYIEKLDAVNCGYNNAAGKFREVTEKKYERFYKMIWNYIKDSYKNDNNIYFYDLFEIANALQLPPSKFLHMLGIDDRKRMNSGINLKIGDGYIYVCINWDNDGFYLCACSSEFINNNQSTNDKLFLRQKDSVEQSRKFYKGRRGVKYSDIDNFNDLYIKYTHRDICKSEFAKLIGVSRPTLDKILKEYANINIQISPCPYKDRCPSSSKKCSKRQPDDDCLEYLTEHISSLHQNISNANSRLTSLNNDLQKANTYLNSVNQDLENTENLIKELKECDT